LKIQLNTDRNITGDQRLEGYLSSLVQDELSRFNDHITRIEIHLADENGPKKGVNDIRCTLEARLEKRQPIVVTTHADTIEKAVSDALVKMKGAITTIYDRFKDHNA
jgi:ribosome-associated translation inhibitor RaiA